MLAVRKTGSQWILHLLLVCHILSWCALQKHVNILQCVWEWEQCVLERFKPAVGSFLVETVYQFSMADLYRPALRVLNSTHSYPLKSWLWARRHSPTPAADLTNLRRSKDVAASLSEMFFCIPAVCMCPKNPTPPLHFFLPGIHFCFK